jgi:hypothetical protein
MSVLVGDDPKSCGYYQPKSTLLSLNCVRIRHNPWTGGEQPDRNFVELKLELDHHKSGTRPLSNVEKFAYQFKMIFPFSR